MPLKDTDPSEDELRDSMSASLQRQWVATFNPKAEEMRMRMARQSANFLKGGKSEALGQHLGSIPMNEYYLLEKKYGAEAMRNPEFLKYLVNKVLRPNGMSHVRL